MDNGGCKMVERKKDRKGECGGSPRTGRTGDKKPDRRGRRVGR